MTRISLGKGIATFVAVLFSFMEVSYQFNIFSSHAAMLTCINYTISTRI